MQEWNGIEKCDQLHIRRPWMDCGFACSKLASPPLVPGQSRHLVPVSAGELPGRDETVCSASNLLSCSRQEGVAYGCMGAEFLRD
ncbi:hypothetical protein SORBI_3002G326050 [Sorghum bicolor]|uniref:Uncharacterized protein n=1 Tax=Sorghum bicolor TaxID=4558 RepID=A0A1W0W6R8_SORBI|nr:hypothetical protein SORBI_3002G326050 [Sorghum bicolor]